MIEMKISTLNEVEKEDELALATQGAPLLFSACAHARTMEMGTTKGSVATGLFKAVAVLL